MLNGKRAPTFWRPRGWVSLCQCCAHNNNSSQFLENYKNETNLYSDNTEISYYWNDNTETYNDIIIPASLINNPEEKVYKNLTIDNVVDKLGAPTYVQGRLTKTIENGQFFKYVYVYNDYTLWFEILYYENTGITITGFRYEGNQSFSQPCEYYDAELAEFRNYKNSLEYLNEEQTKYEKTLKKNLTQIKREHKNEKNNQ